MNDEEREQAREQLRRALGEVRTGGFIPWSELVQFLFDLDERIERLRNPLTPESRGGHERMEVQALGFAFTKACEMMDRGQDPRDYEIPKVLDEWEQRRNEAESAVGGIRTYCEPGFWKNRGE